MSTQKNLITLCFATVFTLGLAACGGGGGGGDAPVTGMMDGDMEMTPPAPAASTEQERFDARIAQNETRPVKEAAVMAAADAVTAATEAANNASMYAGNAGMSLSRAMAARTNTEDTSTASTRAGEQSTAAMTAKAAAEKAEADLGAAIAAFHAAADDQDIDTQDGAVAIKNAANTLKAASEMAMEAANKAMTDAETARDMAMSYAGQAEMYAGTHILGLFMQANAYNIDTPILDNSNTPMMDEAMTVAQQRATEVTNIGAAIATAAGAENGEQEGDAVPSAAWLSDDPDTEETDESAAGLTISVTGLSGDDFVSDTMGTPDDPDTDNDETVAPNAGNIDGVDGFMHGFDIASGEVRVIAFTDREQQVRAQGAVNFVRYIDYGEGDGETIAVAEVIGLGDSPDGGLSYPGTLNKAGDIGAVMGTFTCTADNCSIALNDDGTGVTSITGYTFTGTRAAEAAVTADDNIDYLLFGLWLDEDAAATPDDSFGAFGTGGDPFEMSAVETLTGSATYNGEAVGAHHMTGEAVSWFDADATLTANFDNDMIEGRIENISVNGGEALSNPIHLVETSFANVITLNGAAVMGAQTGPGQAMHDYNGTWSGGFFNDQADDATGDDAHPGSVAGTFGVTRDVTTGEGDDDTMTTTESFVGAFGAHR